MTRLILAAAFLAAICHPASAKTVVLKGAAADSFIAKHFPNADIPGPVRGPFTNGMAKPHKGFARCEVPAMGARSDGAVSTCTLRF